MLYHFVIGLIDGLLADVGWWMGSVGSNEGSAPSNLRERSLLVDLQFQWEGTLYERAVKPERWSLIALLKASMESISLIHGGRSFQA